MEKMISSAEEIPVGILWGNSQKSNFWQLESVTGIKYFEFWEYIFVQVENSSRKILTEEIQRVVLKKIDYENRDL